MRRSTIAAMATAVTVFAILARGQTHAAGGQQTRCTQLSYNRIEAVYNFTTHRGWNFGELQTRLPLGERGVVVGGDYFGFHHGRVGMVRAGVPMKVKGVPIIPSVLGVFGSHENGPGAGVRWEWELGRLYTQGLIGFYRPVHRDGVGLQYIADPVEVGIRPLPGKYRHLQALYSFEGGRYGKYGAHTDTFHSVGLAHPLSERVELVATVVPNHQIVRLGLLVRPGKQR